MSGHLAYLLISDHVVSAVAVLQFTVITHGQWINAIFYMNADTLCFQYQLPVNRNYGFSIECYQHYIRLKLANHISWSEKDPQNYDLQPMVSAYLQSQARSPNFIMPTIFQQVGVNSIAFRGIFHLSKSFKERSYSVIGIGKPITITYLNFL